MVFNERVAVVAADNSWPLWNNTVINGSTIHLINLNSRIVTYKNNYNLQLMKLLMIYLNIFS
jgi:hypothetical protein